MAIGAAAGLTKTSIFKKPTFGSFVGAGGSLYTGITAFRSSRELAGDIRYEGDLTYAEAIRTADIIIEEGDKFAAGQSLQYLASGVHVAGSALVTIAQTKKYAATEATATRARGAAAQYLAHKSAKRTEDEGRASLVSGILGATASLLL